MRTAEYSKGYDAAIANVLELMQKHIDALEDMADKLDVLNPISKLRHAITVLESFKIDVEDKFT